MGDSIWPARIHLPPRHSHKNSENPFPEMPDVPTAVQNGSVTAGVLTPPSLARSGGRSPLKRGDNGLPILDASLAGRTRSLGKSLPHGIVQVGEGLIYRRHGAYVKNPPNTPVTSPTHDGS